MLRALVYEIPPKMGKADKVVGVVLKRASGRHKRHVNNLRRDLLAFTDLFGDRPAGLTTLVDLNKKATEQSVRTRTVKLVSEFAAFLLKMRKLCQRAKSMSGPESPHRNGTLSAKLVNVLWVKDVIAQL